MKKRDKIIYWIATVWLSLGMVSTGVVQLMHQNEEVKNFQHIGFPLYMMTIIGAAKMPGVIVVLIPRFPILKEWAYAGFFFAMSVALASHLIVGGSTTKDIFGPSLLLVLTLVSWYFRPAGRKMQ